MGNDADAIRHALGHFQNVRGHQNGAAGARAFAQHVLDLARGAGIEPGERLVENDEKRVMHQCAGERHFLAHAFGESLAALARMRREPEPIEQLAGALLGKPRLDAPQAGDEFQIFLRRAVSRLAATGSASASIPAMRIAPASGRSKPAIIRNVVVLPAPLGPRSA
jgi:hypothetical protein